MHASRCTGRFSLAQDEVLGRIYPEGKVPAGTSYHLRRKILRSSRPNITPPATRPIAICGSKKRTKRAPASVTSSTPTGTACTIPPPPLPPPLLLGAVGSAALSSPWPPPAPRR